jgi:GMP synthase-like glutamine amidotransferase
MVDKILSIQNTSIETLGNLRDLMENDGYEISTIQAGIDDIPIDPRQYSAIIILGGYMSVYDNLTYLNAEQELIRKAHKNRVPILGICLGSQLIAQALGGRVYKGKKKEIGWHDVTINSNGLADIFKGTSSERIRVFQWHGDTYDLPNTSKLLAYSNMYPQAFRIDSIIGILFHLEVNYNMIRQWTEEYISEIKEENLSIEDILTDKKKEFENLLNSCKIVYSNFSKIVTSN